MKSIKANNSTHFKHYLTKKVPSTKFQKSTQLTRGRQELYEPVRKFSRIEECSLWRASKNSWSCFSELERCVRTTRRNKTGTKNIFVP